MEQWISISHSRYTNRKTIVAVSNLGRIKRLDGTIEEARMNKSKSKKGKSPWNKGMSGADYTNHFKNGVKNQFTSTKEG